MESREVDEEYSDKELEELSEGMANVELSKKTKDRIRAPWSKALIAKVYGRTVGFNYLTFKINTLWKPSARMDCVNLGKDYFLIKFSSDDDYDKVLKGGPWFVGEHFLAIKPWEPYFKASEATLSSVAVWVKLPELPIEFYDLAVLKDIGRAIGPMLRIDSFTATGTRGSYARLCVQVDLEKPLINMVRVGRLKQKVLYEGIGSLCFCCGRLGHKQEAYSYMVKLKDMEVKDAGETSSMQRSTQVVAKLDPNFGAWMLVTRKKNIVRNGRARDTNNNSQYGKKLVKSNLTYASQELGPNVSDNHVSNFTNSSNIEKEGGQAEVIRKEVVLLMQKDMLENLGEQMDVCATTSSSGKSGADVKVTSHSKTPTDKKLAKAKKTKAFKRASQNTGRKTDTTRKNL